MKKSAPAASDKKPIKITVVGDGNVGKTCMLIAYISGVYDDTYIPTVFENHATTIDVDGSQYNITLWDTAGQEDYERLRPLSYPQTNCFLICFSIGQRASYDNVKNKWAPEVRHNMPHAPLILVGTKLDLRDELDSNLVTHREGVKMQRTIRAADYFECSAKKRVGLDKIFEAAVRQTVRNTTKPRIQRNCVLI